jgi:TonB family protein
LGGWERKSLKTYEHLLRHYSILVISLVFGVALLLSADAPAQASGESIARKAQEYVDAMEQFKKERAHQIEETKRKDAEVMAEFEGCQSKVPEERQAAIIKATPPEYPDKAKRANQRGLVVICLLVLSDGSVTRMGVVESSLWPLLDDAAMTSVRSWAFAPAKDEQGAPIEDYRRISVNFSLN